MTISSSTKSNGFSSIQSCIDSTNVFVEMILLCWRLGVLALRELAGSGGGLTDF